MALLDAIIGQADRGTFEQGLKTGWGIQDRSRQEKARGLAGAYMAGQLQGSAAELAQADPQLAGQLMQYMGVPMGTEREERFRNDVMVAAGLDPQGAIQYLQQRISENEAMGIPSPRMREGLLELQQDPVGAMQGIQQMAEAFRVQASPGMGVEEAAFERSIANLSPSEQEKARRIRLGLAPRAVGSASQTIAEAGTAPVVGASEAVIAEQKAAGQEAGKLAAQFKLKPAVEAAVQNALAQSKAAAAQAGEARSNSVAFGVYQTAMKGLIDSLAGTDTGPFIGLVPAVTSNQQIAEGAVAAMAPVLKQLFRSAGEGVFTDKDQELLMAMVPTRRDTPEAIQSKLQNIDAIVRMKLNQGIPQQSAAPSGQQIGRFTVEVE